MKVNQIFNSFIKWAEVEKNIRMVVLTSSMAVDGSHTDFLSDYDIEVYVENLDFFLGDDQWFEKFGDVMVRWPFRPSSTFSDEWITRLVLFEDGTRIDFQITSRYIIDPKRYDNGFKVLLDKDMRGMKIPKPTYSEFIINMPTQEEYIKITSEFWWDAYYVPKYLWRDQLPFAKYMLDNILRYSFLHRMVDWYIGYHNDWKVETGAMGKYYKNMLPIEIWKKFESSYAGGGIEENWDAFYRITDLFRELSKSVGKQLGYEYPEQIDAKVMDFCKKIQITEPVKEKK